MLFLLSLNVLRRFWHIIIGCQEREHDGRSSRHLVFQRFYDFTPPPRRSQPGSRLVMEQPMPIGMRTLSIRCLLHVSAAKVVHSTSLLNVLNVLRCNLGAFCGSFWEPPAASWTWHHDIHAVHDYMTT